MERAKPYVFTKAFQFATAGLVAGMVAFFVSHPFLADVPHQNLNPSFTLGSFFGWFSNAMLGGLVGSTLSAFVGYERRGSRGLLVSASLGLLLGAAAGAGADALCDWLMIHLSPSSQGEMSGFGSVARIFAVSSAISLAVFVSTRTESSRWKRCLLTAAVAALGAALLNRLASAFLLTTMLANLPSYLKTTGIGRIDWEVFAPLFFARFCEVGLALGFAFGLMEATMRRPRP